MSTYLIKIVNNTESGLLIPFLPPILKSLALRTEQSCDGSMIKGVTNAEVLRVLQLGLAEVRDLSRTTPEHQNFVQKLSGDR